MRISRRVEAVMGALVLGALVLSPAVAQAAGPTNTSTTVAPSAGGSGTTTSTSTTTTPTPTTSTTLTPSTTTTLSPGTTTTVVPGSGGAGANTAGPKNTPSNPACTPATFPAGQQHVEAALSARVTKLQGLMTQVEQAPDLTASDRASLEHDISAVELPGIESLEPAVQQATTCKQLRQASRNMVRNFRVYLVMARQVHETIVADRESNIAQKLVGLEPTVRSGLAFGQGQGEDVTPEQGLYGDMQTQLASATAALSGLSAKLLAQSPTAYPGDASVFRTARADETSVRKELRTAYREVKAVSRDVGTGRVGSVGLNPGAG